MDCISILSIQRSLNKYIEKYNGCRFLKNTKLGFGAKQIRLQSPYLQLLYPTYLCRYDRINRCVVGWVERDSHGFAASLSVPEIHTHVTTATVKPNRGRLVKNTKLGFGAGR